MTVVREGTTILDSVTWAVEHDQRWVVLGPNGSGKTTLLRIVGAGLWPTSGQVEILGERLGRVDMRQLRTRISVVSASIARNLRPAQSAFDVVLTGRHAALETWWDQYEPQDHRRAAELLETAGFGSATFAARPFGLLSEGERQQVLLARALMADPDLILMDEPAAGLDLAARERLLRRLADLAGDHRVSPMVLVTHHLEEIPPGVTHAALLRSGRMVAAGPIADTLTNANVSAAFGLPVTVANIDGRWTARAI